MNSTAEAQVTFNIRRPFRTHCGWPARLVGVLQRRSNPYVVAVWNPNYKAEELHTYGADGKFKDDPDEGQVHHFDLVELTNDEYFAWSAPENGVADQPCHAFVVKEPSWPKDQNVARLDHFSLITPLVRGWDLLSEGYDNKEHQRPLTRMKFYNQRTGDVFVLHFTPMDQRELEAKNGN